MSITFGGDLFSDESRADQIFRRFCQFHSDNPDIWRLFERFSLELVKSGREHYGIGAVCERIRWHIDVETKGDEVKINNDFRAYYARMFKVTHPQYDLFSTRRRTSADKPAFDVDLPVYRGSPAGDEATLMEMLRRLVQ